MTGGVCSLDEVEVLEVKEEDDSVSKDVGKICDETEGG